MGNHLNVGNQRIAQAAGFKISFLTKASGDCSVSVCLSPHPCLYALTLCCACVPTQLRSTKTTDNKSTLLHYLVRTIQKKFPELAHFPEYLSAVAPAARGKGSCSPPYHARATAIILPFSFLHLVSGQTLETEIDELRQGIQVCLQPVRMCSLVSSVCIHAPWCPVHGWAFVCLVCALVVCALVVCALVVCTLVVCTLVVCTESSSPCVGH